MTTDYGVFATLVATAGSLASAAAAIRLAFMKRSKWQPPDKSESSRKLGGNELTPEATKIKLEQGITEQAMFEHAQGGKDLVWTKRSQASINIKSTLSFICLIGFGTCTLAAAATLVAVASSK
jgi:hypothetical protein